MIARLIYRAALRTFPKRHRLAYHDEMIAAFEHELASRPNRLAALFFVFAACADAIVSGLGERRRDRRWRLGAVFSALDLVLAWRMLLRYPGLTFVSVLGISVGIPLPPACSPSRRR